MLAGLDLPADEKSDSDWRQLCQENLYHSVFRIAFPLPAGRAFECYWMSRSPCADPQAWPALCMATLNMWPGLQRELALACSPLSPRELACLKYAFEGMTARISSEVLSCSERTVNFHLANAMSKLQVTSKLAAVQRACWLGLI